MKTLLIVFFFLISSISNCQSLKLIHPNGGESFVVGSDMFIEWEGSLPTDDVKIDYSIDNGLNWKFINIVKGQSYLWKNIPKPTSFQCLIRISILNNFEKDTVYTLNGHKSNARGVAFSPDGNIIASASWDKTIKIWDFASRTEIRTLTGHTDWVCSVVFSPDGKTLSSGSWDRTIKQWEVSSGNEIQTLSGHTNWIWSVSYSPDGISLISGSSDRKVKQWNLSTGSETKTLSGHTHLVSSVTVSKDGTTILSGGGDAMVNEWNSLTGTLNRTFSGHTGYVLCVVYNPDGTVIATSSSDNTIKMWDVNSGTLIRTLTGHSDWVWSLAFSPDGLTLASGSADKTIKTWNVSTGNVQSTLYGHTSGIWSIAYSPDGKSIISGSSDSTVKIWNLKVQIPIDDQSVDVFSIVEPLANSTDIEIGEVPICNKKDTLVSNFIRNVGSWKFEVRSITFRGPDANAFSLVSGEPSYIVEPSNTHFAEFRFTPSRVGLHHAEIVIITQSDTLIQTITGIGVNIPLLALANTIDFGDITLGDEKTISEIVVLKNTSPYPINIVKTIVLPPNSEEFTLLSGGGSFNLLPGEEHSVTIQFKPKLYGKITGKIGIEYECANEMVTANIQGNGIGIYVYVPHDSGYVGNRKFTKLLLSNINSESFVYLPPKYKATLRLRNNILAPIKGTAFFNQNDSIYIQLQGNIKNYNELASIRMTVGLGNVDFTWIDIVEFEFLDEFDNVIKYSIDRYSGSFKILGICHEGGARLIHSSTPVPLLTVSPNPSDRNSTIELNLIEKGISTLKIYNSKGFLMDSFGYTSSGSRTIELDTKRYSNGMYFITIETPTQFDYEKLLIVK